MWLRLLRQLRRELSIFMEQLGNALLCGLACRLRIHERRVELFLLPLDLGETRGVIDRWLEEGLELEADILPVIAERTGKPRARPIRSWDYFTEAIRAARRRRLAQAKRAPHRDEPVPEPVNSDRVIERMADWINSGTSSTPARSGSSARWA